MRLIPSAALVAALSSSAVYAAEPEPTAPPTDPVVTPSDPTPEPAIPEPPVTPKAKPWKGFFVQTEDGNFKLKVGTHLQFDGHFFPGDEADAYTDTFRVRRFRPNFRATVFKNFDLRWQFEIAASTLQVLDAVVENTHLDYLRLRVGKDKAPESYDHLQSSTASMFFELGTTAQLSGNRDIGVQLVGDVAEGLLNYQVGLFDGTADNSSLETNGDDDTFEFAGRLTFKPFALTDIEALKQLAIGGTFSFGDTTTKTSAPGLAAYRTTGGATPFAYKTAAAGTAADATNTVTADGTRTRFGAHLDWRVGPVSLFGELVQSSQELSLNGVVTEVSNVAYQAYAAVLLTGDKADRNGVTPLHPFDPSAGQWGAFELAVRFGGLDFDDAAFDDGLATGTSQSALTSLTFGFNWYFNAAVKLQINYERTTFEADTGDDRPTENFLGGRVQFNF